MGILQAAQSLLSFFGPETPRPPGLNTSHRISNVYLDGFFRSPNACVPSRALFITTLLEVRV